MLEEIILPEKINNIISFLISPPMEGGLLIVKIIFIFFGLFFFIGTIYFLFTTSWLRKIILQDLYEVLTYKPYWLRDTKGKWRKILHRLRNNLESEYKLAVMEADSMLNDALKQMGFTGESLGERLEKITKDILPNLNEALEAHKIRNNIVHDPDYKLTLEEAKRVMSIFEKALKTLEVI